MRSIVVLISMLTVLACAVFAWRVLRAGTGEAEPASNVGWRFWRRWLAASTVGWLVGLIAAIPITFEVVNRLYPKETNLTLGVCAGAGIGLSQVVAVRLEGGPFFQQADEVTRWLPPSWWSMGCSRKGRACGG